MPDMAVEPLIAACESEFLPIVRSGAWTDIGFRSNMEDVYVRLDDFMHHYGLQHTGEGPNAFYGVRVHLFIFFYLWIMYVPLPFCKPRCHREENQIIGTHYFVWLLFGFKL